MSSTDTLGLLKKYRTTNSPPVEGCQAPLDGVVVACLHQSIPLLWRGVRLRLTGWCTTACAPIPQTVGANSPPMEGCQAPLDGVVYNRLRPQFPKL